MNQRALLQSVLLAMVLPFLASLIYFVALVGSDLANWIYGLTKVFTLVWPLVIFLFLEKAGVSNLLPKTWTPHLASIPPGLLTGGIIFTGVMLLFHFSLLGDYVANNTAGIKEKVNDFRIETPVKFLAFGAFICLAHSLLEEYYWRWFVYGRLSRYVSNGWAIFWASLAFAAHHYVVLRQYFTPAGAIFFGTAVGVGGALWCWMYQKQKSLLGCWTSHLLVDVVIYILGYQLIFP